MGKPTTTRKKLSATQKGELAEVKCMCRFIEKGFTVCTPHGHDQKYDLIVDTGKERERVQVKTGKLKKEVIIWNCSRSPQVGQGKNRIPYSADDVDAFAVYCPELDECYYVPVNKTTTTQGSLRVVPAKNKQIKKVMMAEDYIL